MKCGMRRLIRNGLLLSLTFDQEKRIRWLSLMGFSHPLFGWGYINSVKSET